MRIAALLPVVAALALAACNDRPPEAPPQDNSATVELPPPPVENAVEVPPPVNATNVATPAKPPQFSDDAQMHDDADAAGMTAKVDDEGDAAGQTANATQQAK